MGAHRTARWIARQSGTLLPLIVLAGFLWATREYAGGGLTWERPTVYVVTILSLVFGLDALFKLAARPSGKYPTVLMLTFIYEKAAIFLTFFGITFAALNDLYPRLPDIPPSVVFGLLVASALSLIVNNVVLRIGGALDLYGEGADPVPFRASYRWIRDTLRR